MTGVPPNKRDVNMVFQSYALFPHMTVQDNVAFGLPGRGMPRGEISRRVYEMPGTVQQNPASAGAVAARDDAIRLSWQAGHS